jgi:hypothetical protein
MYEAVQILLKMISTQVTKASSLRSELPSLKVTSAAPIEPDVITTSSAQVAETPETALKPIEALTTAQGENLISKSQTIVFTDKSETSSDGEGAASSMSSQEMTTPQTTTDSIIASTLETTTTALTTTVSTTTVSVSWHYE